MVDFKSTQAYNPSPSRRGLFSRTKGLWHFVGEAAVHGGAELRSKAARLAMESISEALDAPDFSQRFGFNDGVIDPVSASRAVAAVMPSGAKALLERLISSDALGAYDRGEALMAYAQALDDEARPAVLSALKSEALREYAARAIKRSTKGKHDSEAVAAAREERWCRRRGRKGATGGWPRWAACR